MQAWQELLKLALLGTERQAKAPVAGEVLQPYLEQLYPGGQVAADSRRETAFLSAAALIGAYYRAGRHPESFAGENPALAGEEDLPVVGDTAAAHLRLILSDKDLSPLLPEWLRAVADHRLRLPPLLLPHMLDIAARQKSLRPAIARAIGRRGKWLARHQEPWQKIVDEAPLETEGELDSELWETGALAQRVAYLARQRTLDPERARALLQEVWKRDAAKDRAALLETFATGLGQSDEGFLENCLADKSKEVQQRAAGLLARLPQSAFSRRLKERLRAWLTYNGKSGLLGAINKQMSGKKGQLNVNPPEQWDKSWQQDGIGEKAPGGKGQKAWWLEQTVALAPPSHWCEQWNLTPEEVLALSHKHEWEAPLRAGLRQAIVRHKDRRFSEAWLREVDAGDAELWALLEPAQGERVIAELIVQARGGDALANVLSLLQQLQQLQHPWSEAFSRTIADAWQRLLSGKQQTPIYYPHQAFKSTALGLHPGAIGYFQQQMQPHADSESPNRKQVQDTLDTLRVRLDMLSAIAITIAITTNEVKP